jgi:hypothetical protein
MSSLAAARADNFYYPPDFDPVKHQTLNKVRLSPPPPPLSHAPSHALSPVACRAPSPPR